ncbi:peptidase C39 family protein [Myxococcus sp. CA051A]|uniref:peptidase C39 family protein n=1 Tax=unclassified Myxococcus TaxID=2648731 RepID=UPI00157A4EE0|nr:peptidase C39 family protein [Myxococcus sp. CA039A]NTX61378.1 peptidase C39 family protein [Myxococcus sp. CA051A]
MNARSLSTLALLLASTQTACVSQQKGREDSPSDEPGPPARLWRRSAVERDFERFTREGTALTGDGALVLDASARTDSVPVPTGRNEDGGTRYHEATYRLGSAVSEVQLVPGGFTSVVPSFDAQTPPGTWVKVTLAARIEGAWTKDYELGVWAFDKVPVARHSVDGQGDADGQVYTDTLNLKRRADALRMTVWLFSSQPEATPRVRALTAAVSDKQGVVADASSDRAAWGTVLEVPGHSQMLYPEGGPVWCSPTSTTMLLGYWGRKLGRPELTTTVPSSADRTYDWVYKGTGNWAFNTAYASAIGDGALHGAVLRLDGFAQVERLIAAGIPVSISIAYEEGELTGSPVRSSDGHLIVLKGFTPEGDVVCNDPAFKTDETVSVTYKRDELWRAWQHSRGAAYVLWPSGTAFPAEVIGLLR